MVFKINLILTKHRKTNFAFFSWNAFIWKFFMYISGFNDLETCHIIYSLIFEQISQYSLINWWLNYCIAFCYLSKDKESVPITFTSCYELEYTPRVIGPLGGKGYTDTKWNDPDINFVVSS